MPSAAYIRRRHTIQGPSTTPVRWSFCRSLLRRLQRNLTSSEEFDVVLRLLDEAIHKTNHQPAEVVESKRLKRLKRLRSHYLTFRQTASINVNQLVCFWTINQENALGMLMSGDNIQLTNCSCQFARISRRPIFPGQHD